MAGNGFDQQIGLLCCIVHRHVISFVSMEAEQACHEGISLTAIMLTFQG